MGRVTQLKQSPEFPARFTRLWNGYLGRRSNRLVRRYAASSLSESSILKISAHNFAVPIPRSNYATNIK